MDVQGILNKIESDAREAAAQQLDEAKRRAQELREQSEARMRAEREAMERKADADAQELESRMLRMAELEDRKARLGAKRRVLDEAFEGALARLRALPAQEKRAFFLEELAAAAQGDETLCIGDVAGDWFDAAFVEQANTRLKVQGRPGSLRTGEALGGACGFELRRGGAALTCTFEALLDSARLELESDAARMLFSE